MSGYIEKDAFERAMYHAVFKTDTEIRWDSGCWIRYKLFENILEQQPTADVVEVVHGEWIWDDKAVFERCRCSECGYYRQLQYPEPENYCPNCGADMRKETQ